MSDEARSGSERDGEGAGTEGAGPSGVRRKYSAEEVARIFGDVLPEQTRDDLTAQRAESGVDGDGAPGSDAAAERWYRENRPPHHGG